jgi:hypothetical protein
VESDGFCSVLEQSWFLYKKISPNGEREWLVKKFSKNRKKVTKNA